MKKMPRVIVTRDREVFTNSEFWHTSWCMLEQGKTHEAGSFYQFLGCLVFTAFTLEAYLNHIEPKVLDGRLWKKYERMGRRGKFDAIAKKIGLEIVCTDRPWYVMDELFRFRNEIAHGRSMKISEVETVSLEEHNTSIMKFVQTPWEKLCTRENAERVRGEIEAIVIAIHEKAGIPGEHPFAGDFQSCDSTFVED